MATKTMVAWMVTTRKKTAASLGAALNVHTEKANAALREMLEPYLQEGDSVPDLAMLQRLLGRRLKALRAELVEVDRLHRQEQRGDKALRDARDGAMAELVDLISQLRFIVDKSCGQPVCQQVWGLEGTLPRDPVVIQGIATEIVQQLRAGQVRLPVDPLPGVSIDLTPWIEVLGGPLGRLDAALEQLADERRETVESQLDKSEAMAEYDRTYVATARILEDFFRYAGKTDLAQRVRTNRRSAAAAVVLEAPGSAGAQEPPGTIPATAEPSLMDLLTPADVE